MPDRTRIKSTSQKLPVGPSPWLIPGLPLSNISGREITHEGNFDDVRVTTEGKCTVTIVVAFTEETNITS